MIEVLVAATILGLATFMVLGLLKLSDEMSYRARVDAKLSQVMRARAANLVKMSFDSLRQKVSGKVSLGGAGSTFEFIHGGFTSAYVNESSYLFADSTGNGFPFLESQDPFTYNATGSLRFLLSGKPLPGDPASNYRSVFPFVEKIKIIFQNSNGQVAVPSVAVRVRIEYEVWWINEFIKSTQKVELADFEKLGAIAFEFIKYDPSLY